MGRTTASRSAAEDTWPAQAQPAPAFPGDGADMTHLMLKLANGRLVNVNTDKLAEVHAAIHEAADDRAGGELLESYARELVTGSDNGGAEDHEGEVGGVLNFIRPVSRATFDARMEVCSRCEQSSVLMKRSGSARHDMLRCRECGCVMNVKARLSFAECPRGLFGKG